MDLFLDQTTKDLVLVDGDFKIITDQPTQLMQRLFIRLKSFKRELFWNLDYGIDYLNDVYGLGRKKRVVDTLIISEIKKEEMVDHVTYFESEVNNYKYACKFTVTLLKTNIPVTFYILTEQNGITLTDQDGNVLTVRIN